MIESSTNSIQLDSQVLDGQFETLEQICKKNDALSAKDAHTISDQVLCLSADENLSKDKISTLITVIDKLKASGSATGELENVKISLQMKLSEVPSGVKQEKRLAHLLCSLKSSEFPLGRKVKRIIMGRVSFRPFVCLSWRYRLSAAGYACFYWIWKWQRR